MELEPYGLDVLGCEFISLDPGFEDFSDDTQLFAEVILQPGLKSITRET